MGSVALLSDTPEAWSLSWASTMMSKDLPSRSSLLHVMTEEERANGPIASVFVNFEDLIKTFREQQLEGLPKIDYVGVNMGEGGIYPLIRL
jgi:hypothetical protein